MTDETKTNPAVPEPYGPNWDHVGALLNVIHGAASAGPKYAYIVSRAEALLHKHMQDNPEAPAVELTAPVTAPPAALAAGEPPASGDQSPEVEPTPAPPSGDGEPGQDATAPTLTDRRV